MHTESVSTIAEGWRQHYCALCPGDCWALLRFLSRRGTGLGLSFRQMSRDELPIWPHCSLVATKSKSILKGRHCTGGLGWGLGYSVPCGCGKASSPAGSLQVTSSMWGTGLESEGLQWGSRRGWCDRKVPTAYTVPCSQVYSHRPPLPATALSPWHQSGYCWHLAGGPGPRVSPVFLLHHHHGPGSHQVRSGLARRQRWQGAPLVRPGGGGSVGVCTCAYTCQCVCLCVCTHMHVHMCRMCMWVHTCVGECTWDYVSTCVYYKKHQVLSVRLVLSILHI